MKAIDFKRVFQVAQTEQILTEDEKSQAYHSLGGIAFGNDRRIATVKICAYWLRYHCLQFNGVWDMQELDNHKIYFKKVDLLD